MKYKFLLFDADGTLFDFNKNEFLALRASFSDCGMTVSDEEYATIYPAYHKINDDLWKDLELGRVTKAQLLRLRFERLFERFSLGEVPSDFNDRYIYNLSQGAYLFDGALDICKRLSEIGGIYMCIVTNGVEAVQVNRYAQSGLAPYFDGIFISEKVGVPKPKKEFFDHVFSAIPNFEPARALIIGDSLTSDIKGGINAGIDSCWLDLEGTADNPDIVPTYKIDNLEKIFDLIK